MPEERLGFSQMLGGLLAAPKDVVLCLPRVILLGNLQCCVENHCGILQYTPIAVRLQTDDGIILVEGQDLVLTSLSAEAAYIEGKIRQVQYEA